MVGQEKSNIRLHNQLWKLWLIKCSFSREQLFFVTEYPDCSNFWWISLWEGLRSGALIWKSKVHNTEIHSTKARDSFSFSYNLHLARRLFCAKMSKSPHLKVSSASTGMVSDCFLSFAIHFSFFSFPIFNLTTVFSSTIWSVYVANKGCADVLKHEIMQFCRITAHVAKPMESP